MSTVFQIFWRDLKRLLRNPVALVITIGVCVIPSLYAWYNIVANWDPYANTQNVKVAVANNDQGTSNDYVGELNAGVEVVNKLRDNDQLGWTFVSSTEAREGVERGDYYAAIVIPKDFSQDLTSMLTGDFVDPKVTYYVNEKKNAIAPKVTDKGASSIEQQVNSTFVTTVSDMLVAKLQEGGNSALAAGAATTGTLIAKVNGASQGIADVRTSLSNMGGTIDTTKSAVSGADETLAGLLDELPRLTTALDEGNKLLGSTRGTVRDLTTSLSGALSQGGVLLGQASAQANTGIGKVTGLITSATTKVDGALDGLQGAIDDNAKIIQLIRDTDFGLDSINQNMKDVANSLESANGTLETVRNALKTQNDDMVNTSSSIENLGNSANTSVQTGISTLTAAQSTFNSDVLPQLGDGLDSFSSVSGDLEGVISGLKPTITQARGTLTQLNATLDQAKTALAQTDTALADVATMLDTTKTDIAALRSSEAVSQLEDALGLDSSEIADFIASPVGLTTKTVYPVANYGSGVAPFYTNLALWVGGFVLIAIYKQEVDRTGLGAAASKIQPAQAYFGRWLLFVLLGQVQAVIVCVGDLVLGMQCTQPVLFVLAGMWISFIYVNIIFAMAATFKHVGKGLAVVLVIVQIPGSSGMYPIEMMPGFYRWLNPLLPFTYGINAMRETIGGMYGLSYLKNLGALAAFLAIALIIGVVLRRSFLNLNVLFDRELAGTGVMICEKDGMGRDAFGLRTTINAMLDSRVFRSELVVRAQRFEHNYPRLVRAGFALEFGLPVLLFTLTSALDLSVDGKIVMLMLWIAAVVLADIYLINVEYVRENLNEQMRVARMRELEQREAAGSLDACSATAPAAAVAAENTASAPTAGSATVAHFAATSPQHPAHAPKGGDLDA